MTQPTSSGQPGRRPPGVASQADLDWLDAAPTSSTHQPAQPAKPKPVNPVSPTPPKPPPPPGGRITKTPAPRVPSGSSSVGAQLQPRPPKPPVPPHRPTAVERTRQHISFGRKLKRGGIIVAVVLALWVAFLVYAPIHAWNQITVIDDTSAGARPAQQPGTAFLIVGTDRRDDLTPQQQSQLGVGSSASGGRTDVMMLYYIPPHGNPALISLPRDSYLPIPGQKKNKLNAAYAFGGPKLLEQTVEDATGLRIDGYLEVQFSGFVQMVDLVGGVEVCLDKPMVDKDAHINLVAGCQTLDGTKALGYVRQRHQDPMGDLGRVQRQREIMTKVIAKLLRPSTVLNPFRYWKTCQGMVGVFSKGQSTSLSMAVKAGLSALQFAKGNVISLTVPISNSNAWTSAGSSVLWDDAKAKDMFGMLAKGDTSQLAQFK